MKVGNLVVLGAVLVALPAVAEETFPNSSSTTGWVEVQSKMLYFHGTFGGLHLTQHGKRVDLGLFGSRYEEVFGDFPDALDSARTARTLSLIGTPMMVVGTVVVLVELIMIFTAPEITSVATGHWVGLGGGLLLQVAGSILFGLSQPKFFDAVNRYNFGLVNRNLPPEQRFDPVRQSSTRSLTVPLLAFRF